jgi:16S rRNA (guanine1516-N2)-methyltransferase
VRSKIAIIEGEERFDAALLTALRQLPECEYDELVAELPALELQCVNGVAQLTNNNTKSRILVSFNQSELKRRLRPANLNGELVVRAVIGRRKGASLRVLDATAGLGRDALLLAAAGCEVTLVERIPVLAILLQQAVRQAQNCDHEILAAAARRMYCVTADSQIALNENRQVAVDVVYLDPMYQSNSETTVAGLKPSAAVNKHMATLQTLAQINEQHYSGMQSADDNAKLFELALARAASKVVVKRAPKAPYLAGHKPSSTIAGKAARFDVYAC